jgi:hypothetical protein
MGSGGGVSVSASASVAAVLGPTLGPALGPAPSFSSSPPIMVEATPELIQHTLSNPTPANIGTALDIFVTLIKEKKPLYINDHMRCLL